jgi:hypothetical protein
MCSHPGPVGLTRSLMRIMKITEEVGEVSSAVTGTIGQIPARE